MTDNPAMAAKPRRLERAMRKRGWSYKTPRDGLRRRAWSLASERGPWWDWGHRLMALVGTDDCGNWDEPTPPTWWYRLDPGKPMRRTRYPRHRLTVVKTYDEFAALTAGLDEAALDEWRAVGYGQDRDLHTGRQFWGEWHTTPTHWEVALIGRWCRMARRHDWWGVRSWLYSQGLYAAVNKRKPRSCKAVPTRGSGGYDHWHCQSSRRHEGPHRYGNYAWVDGGTLVNRSDTP